MKAISLYSAVFLGGLSAGFYYAWQVSVIPGTKLISDSSFLESMQNINRAILNPAFILIFFGTLLTLVAAAYFNFNQTEVFRWILAATLIYVFGVLGVTIAGNVPLNEYLDQVQLGRLDARGLSHVRDIFEKSWNLRHLIRTAFALLSFFLILGALYRYGSETLNLK
ncbi:DUF1772 domain-containing protein [Croceimicrobium sp.]|uniref:anthrone oxygenase family protein n=1 Tax=Croceimicrobium sp. TaxID=2828340 RepID=UPI003BA9F130